MKNEKENQIKIFSSDNWNDYELLDTGLGEKLERVGEYTFIRPYEDAVWKRSLEDRWKNADGKFEKKWQIKTQIPDRWEMSYGDIKFWAMPTPFRHFGFFPEQASHWDFIEERIKSAQKPIKFLNLFGYTGVASLFALRAGAEVTHVDASKQILKWAKENQELSNMGELPMRIIEDDVLKFIEREARRGNKYDCVIMDPPKFGKGPKGEVWKIEEKLAELLSGVRKILSDKPVFVILTSYATDSSSLALGHALSEMMQSFGGNVDQGELCVLEKSNGRAISLANTARWSQQ